VAEGMNDPSEEAKEKGYKFAGVVIVFVYECERSNGRSSDLDCEI
jgi:hypothetical protein